jgi:hypothetical protein
LNIIYGVWITVSTRRGFRLGRKPALCASAVLAVLTAAALPSAVGAATSASTVKAASGTTPVTLGAAPLGLDVGPWDTLYSDPSKLSMMQSYLKAAGIGQLHYGGGGTADQYDWQNNTVVNNPTECGTAPTPASFTEPPCPHIEPFAFSQFSANARAVGDQSYVTVDYGTGTPDMAANWVTKADTTAGEGVAQWSIGNESYGCWEYDSWLTGAPLDDTGYAANDNATCPWVMAGDQGVGVTEMANSYVANALPYMQEMTAAATAAGDSIKIGVPWAFDGTVGGAGVPNNASWDSTLLTGLDTATTHVSFVEAHWYPYGFGGAPTGTQGKPTVQQVIQSVETIPTHYASIQGILAQNDSDATVTIGETGVSYLPTSVPCLPAGALFAAGDALEWLSSGAQTVDWWPMETGDNPKAACNTPDEAMFTGNGTPDTMYTGYLLASQLAKPNAQLSRLTVTNLSDRGNTNNAVGFQSVLPDGQVVVALMNTNTSSAQRVSINSSLTGNLSTESYIAGDQAKATATSAAPTRIVTGTTTAGAIAGSITVPAQSIVVLKSHLPSKVTVGAASSVKAGTKVTLKGTLTLNGKAAPAGTVVKVYRRVAGSSVNSATLTVKTTAAGAFTATDLPPAYGRYNYVASYAGTSLYATASATFPVHVTALKPSLKLAFSAGTVSPGRKVTVTATLGAWHTNRTLVIYAQPKGSAKQVIERGTINSKGRLVVSFTMKSNTTFTVTFSGDKWYGSASATGTVKA